MKLGKMNIRIMYTVVYVVIYVLDKKKYKEKEKRNYIKLHSNVSEQTNKGKTWNIIFFNFYFSVFSLFFSFIYVHRCFFLSIWFNNNKNKECLIIFFVSISKVLKFFSDLLLLQLKKIRFSKPKPKPTQFWEAKNVYTQN